jgi:hypothetical protein
MMTQPVMAKALSGSRRRGVQRGASGFSDGIAGAPGSGTTVHSGGYNGVFFSGGGAKPNVDNVNWTKGIHASAPERECDMTHHDATPRNREVRTHSE